jgi:hypothetical protein
MTLSHATPKKKTIHQYHPTIHVFSCLSLFIENVSFCFLQLTPLAEFHGYYGGGGNSESNDNSTT